MKTRHILIVLFLFLCFPLVGCAQQLTRSSSSISKIIEPVKDSRRSDCKAPLTLPVSVAIVTVPGSQAAERQVPATTLRLAAEKLREQLLANPKYVRSVVLVDRDDTQGRLSLGRIRAAYDADIAIVLSYQQDQRSSQKGVFGLTDLTIVGMFLVPGVQIDTSSVIEGKVIHIPSNAIIFRASGSDRRSAHSTTHAVQASLAEQSMVSIEAATEDFGKALNRAVEKFDKYDFSHAVPLPEPQPEPQPVDAKTKQPDSRAANDYWEQVDDYKRVGGGAFGGVSLVIAALACLVVRGRK